MEVISMKPRYVLILALLCAGVAGAAVDDAAKKKAADRYAEDQKLCAEESNSSRRMQCLRDAKDEYNKALGLTEGEAKAAAAPDTAAPACKDCGKVTAVKVVEKEGKGGALGMIAGGVVGGLLGNQVGAGRGKTVATVAGAAGGAYAGNKVEEKMTATKTWAVSVHFDNGDERVFNFESNPGYAVGDPVKASGSGIVRR
jgi:outer membrane lipoprotein SlyB